jgi:hypothetical protein
MSPGSTRASGALGLALEAQVAHAADHLHVISRPLADHVIARWGIDPARVTILPNGIDAARFAAIAPPRAAAFTLGYAGALVGYEGLDLLLDALALLRAQDRTIALTIIGDGPLREALEQQALRLGPGRQVHFAGRLARRGPRASGGLSCHRPARRASPVTELVPPIKLVEAMALGVVPVVPDLPVFRAEARDGETALFFRADDAASLAAPLPACTTMARSPAAWAKPRAHALGTRDWAQQAAAIAAHLPVPPEPLPDTTAAEDGTAPEPEPEPEPEVVPFPDCLPDKPALIAAVADQGPRPRWPRSTRSTGTTMPGVPVGPCASPPCWPRPNCMKPGPFWPRRRFPATARHRCCAPMPPFSGRGSSPAATIFSPSWTTIRPAIPTRPCPRGSNGCGRAMPGSSTCCA